MGDCLLEREVARLIRGAHGDEAIWRFGRDVGHALPSTLPFWHCQWSGQAQAMAFSIKASLPRNTRLVACALASSASMPCATKHARARRAAIRPEQGQHLYRRGPHRSRVVRALRRSGCGSRCRSGRGGHTLRGGVDAARLNYLRPDFSAPPKHSGWRRNLEPSPTPPPLGAWLSRAVGGSVR